MELYIQESKRVKAKYLELDVAVRYDDEDMAYDAPLRDGKSWKAKIDLDSGVILNWPEGKILSFQDMKICDEGIYVLYDKNMKEVARIEGYVPNKLLPGEYGDYLSLDINEEGKIINWLEDANLEDFEQDSE